MNAQPRIRLSRRAVLRLSGLCALVLTGPPTRVADAKDDAAGDIRQPDRPGPHAFIERAFAMRRRALDGGDQPYGAVVVRDGMIVGQAPSRVVLDRDPTAHAEMAAIRDAARRLASRDLSGCLLYSSSKPCPMCEAAAYWAGVARMFHGTGIADGGAPDLCG